MMSVDSILIRLWMSTIKTTLTKFIRNVLCFDPKIRIDGIYEARATYNAPIIVMTSLEAF